MANKQKQENAARNLKIEYVSVDSLHSSPQNPRVWTEKAKSDLKESLKRFGVTEPIIVNSCPSRKNRIISGHFRWTMAREMGIKNIPVVFVNIPSETKERELLLRMNANQGAWNYDLLKLFDIDLLLDVGFDDADLSQIFDENLEIEDDNFDTEKELAAIKETDIKPGDMFALGKHRLICADSTLPATAKILLGNLKANVINTDVPYNIGLSYDRGMGSRKNYGGTTNDAKSNEEYKKFLKNIIENALLASHKDCHVFIWHDEKYVGMVQELYRQAGISQKRLCIWAKGNQNPTPQVAFNKATELCLYGVRGNPYLSDRIKNLNEFLNKEVSTGNRLIDDLEDLFNIWLAKRIPGNQYEHPTQKPPTLYEKSLRRCSKPGDIILDLCAGSGSIMAACEQLKRSAFMAEIEPIFCQLILNRYAKLTNKKITKIN
jgi:DNA modification methylase